MSLNKPQWLQFQQNFSLPDSHARIEVDWTLRFRDPALEDLYITHLMMRDRRMSRRFLTISLIFAFLISFADLFILPSAAAIPSMLVRMTLFLACWGVAMATLLRPRPSPHLPFIIMGGTVLATLALSISQWLAWRVGIYRPYQTFLLVVMFVPLLGCMPWRIGVVGGALSALIVAIAEIFCQPAINVRDLHLAYIVLAWMTGSFASYAYERHSRQLFLLNLRFLQKSRVDPLTRLPNRRDLELVMPRLIRQAARDRLRMAVAILDIDHFKSFNDHYGHSVGDTVLTSVSQALVERAEVRPDFVARYGGEEFVAIWIDPVVDAETLGEGLRTAVESLHMPHEYCDRDIVTASVGVISCMPRATTTPSQLIDPADLVLYRAKEAGRNCVRTRQIVLPAEDEQLMEDEESLLDEVAGSEIQENLLETMPPSQVSRKDYLRWRRNRGFYERSHLQGIAVLAVFTHLMATLIAYVNLPLADINIFVLVMSLYTVPAMLFGYHLVKFDLPVRYAHEIMWLFVIPSGLAVCFALGYGFANGVALPYESLMLIIFINFFVGCHTWVSAAICSWLLTFIYIGVLAYFGVPHWLTSIIPFMAMNVLGVFASYELDRQSLDTFLKREKLETLASHDTLTGLGNRHGLENYYAAMLPVLAASERPTLTVAMIDVDYFKAYNDFYGHPAGDVALRTIAGALKKQGLRSNDFAARFGGEEFVLVWYQVCDQNAEFLGKRVCEAIRALNITHEKSVYGKITISMGMVHGQVSAKAGMDELEQMLQQADQALYIAKSNGRNCLEMQEFLHGAPAGAEESEMPLQVV